MAATRVGTRVRRIALAGAGAGLLLGGCNLGAQPVEYAVDGHLLGRYHRAPADVNGDGHGDVLVGTTVMFGDGTGAFSTGPLQVPATLPTQRLAAADVDGDDRVDLVGLGSGGVYLSLGDGAGTFGEPTLIAPSVLNLYDMAVGDVDGDGNVDVVSLDAQAGGEVRLGDGAGGFAGPIHVEAPELFFGQGALLDDLDGDGDADLVVAADGDATDGGAVAVFLGDGTGSLAPPTLYSVRPDASALNAGACDLVLGDFDADGNLDAVTGGKLFGAAPSLLLGDGAGGFGTSIPIPSLDTCELEAADVDGDGALDLIARSDDDLGVDVWWGDGTGQFGDPHSLGGGTFLVDDLDGDGKPDVVVAGGEKVSVFMNRLSGRPTH